MYLYIYIYIALNISIYHSYSQNKQLYINSAPLVPIGIPNVKF